jgi:uncharacterized protein (DUF1697 family)
MRQEKLKWFFEKLKFTNVKVVISSGNVVFESRSKNIPALEAKIEQALPKYLGFKSMTIIRSQQDLQKLIDQDPFRGKIHSRKTYLLVTFLKNEPLKSKRVKKLKYDRAVCNAFIPSDGSGPEIMVQQITTRTWKTINRIVDKF